MIKNTIVTAIVCILMIGFVISTYARVLVIADYFYYGTDNGSQKINRYMENVNTIEGKTTQLEIFNRNLHKGMFPGCTALWQLIRDRYASSRPTGDTIEGVVLVGDLPELLCYNSNNGVALHPLDYVYMDLYNVGSAYTDIWTDVWTKMYFCDTLKVRPNNTIILSDTVINRTVAVKGDLYPEIWVSRIYAKTILNLREDPAQAWEYPLEEYEIMNRYFDKVYERMHNRALVPPRAFAMGQIPEWYPDSVSATNALKNNLGFDSLNLASIRFFTSPNNNSANWQAQLQSGPCGGASWGAFKGVQFTDTNSYRNMINESFALWPDGLDTKGYEWAGVFEHSNGNCHTWSTGRNGVFYSTTIAPLWARNSSSGYRGSYFWNDEKNEDVVWGEYHYYTYAHFGWDKYTNIANWKVVLPKFNTDPAKDTSSYRIYLYYNVSSQNEQNTYYKILENTSTLIAEGGINQQIRNNPFTYDGVQWSQVKDTIFRFHGNDTICIQFVPSCNNSDPWSNPSISITDAVLFRNINNSNRHRIVDDNDRKDTAKFWCDSWKERSFLSMVDDGGLSKTAFFVSNGCNNFAYNYSNNIGLLYGLAHSGLIGVGTASPGWPDCGYSLMTGELGRGSNVGKAFLKMVRSRWSHPDLFYERNTYMCVGAATLRSRAYKAYYDSDNLSIIGTTLEEKYSHFIKNDITIDDVTDSTSLVLYAGNNIRLLPETRLKGKPLEEIHLKADISLKQ